MSAKTFVTVDDLACRLVWDGTDEVRIPPEMGTPRNDQMQGTAAERLAELAGRVCYDSLGKGRSSADFHKHIAEVGHLNVYEHHHTVLLLDRTSWLASVVGRPGVFVTTDPTLDRIRVAFNQRAALDWQKHALYYDDKLDESYYICDSVDCGVEPENDRERFVTLFLQGSRGFSHELVRHRWQCAVSQRSTRYVDEHQSPWVLHPAVASAFHGGVVYFAIASDEVESMKDHYLATVVSLEKHFVKNGVDKFSARKQARGAARGFLGNALLTELLFTASVSAWRHMLRMRLSNAADAEIRCIFSKVLVALRDSRYADRFADLATEPAADGLGVVLAGGGAK